MKTAELDSLKKKRSLLDARIAKLTKERRLMQNKIHLLEKRIQLEQVVGKESGVVVGYSSRPELRGKPGTVTKVNIKRAEVMIAGVSWSVPFDLLKLSQFDYEIEASINRGLGIN